MDTLDRKYVNGFFDEIIRLFPVDGDIASIIVTHLLPDRHFFLRAVGKLTQIASIVPKAKSMRSDVRDWASAKFCVDMFNRSAFGNHSMAIDFIERRSGGKPVVILDIGGYFAASVNELRNSLGNRFLGVVEDTENGHQKYAARHSLLAPVISVARSPLKNPEDYLVGQSIVFSVEALLREQGDILHGRTACVIGYGKVGRSIAALLNARSVRTVVYDRDPIKSVEAMSHGFAVTQNLENALKGAGLVFCATGNISLHSDDFRKLDAGAYVATVTSSEDELETEDLCETYRLRNVGDFVSRYSSQQHYFYMLNRGQAVNFIHGASVGPFIYLVQAEILCSISSLVQGVLEPGIHTNSDEIRRKVAGAWYTFFGSNTLNA